MSLETAERTRDIVGDGRLLRDDELLTHASWLWLTKERKMISRKNPQGKGGGLYPASSAGHRRARNADFSSQPLELATRKRRDDAAYFEVGQERRDLRCVQAAARGERVHIAGFVTQCSQQPRRRHIGRWRSRCNRSGRGRVSRRNAEFFKDVVGAFGEFGALFDECVATFGGGEWIDPGIANTSCPAPPPRAP